MRVGYTFLIVDKEAVIGSFVPEGRLTLGQIIIFVSLNSAVPTEQYRSHTG